MPTVNMHEAKSNLSRLVEQVETGHEREIIIARNGRPAARLVALEENAASQRIGVAKGQFIVPPDIDESNEEIARMFSGTDE